MILSHRRNILYLQIASLDLTRTTLNALWYILWDPTQSQATRPLAIQTAGNWFAYGWNLTKNIMELYNSTGHINTSYNYTPFGGVSSTGGISQPIQWSSEMFDAELGLVYYNYRHYNPYDGRWTSRDPIGIKGGYNLYAFSKNKCNQLYDILGNSLPEALNPVMNGLKRVENLLTSDWFIRKAAESLGILAMIIEGYSCVSSLYDIFSERPACFKREKDLGAWQEKQRNSFRGAVSGCSSLIIGFVAPATKIPLLSRVVLPLIDQVINTFSSLIVSDETIDGWLELEPGPPIKCDCKS